MYDDAPAHVRTYRNTHAAALIIIIGGAMHRMFYICACTRVYIDRTAQYLEYYAQMSKKGHVNRSKEFVSTQTLYLYTTHMHAYPTRTTV